MDQRPKAEPGGRRINARRSQWKCGNHLKVERAAVRRSLHRMVRSVWCHQCLLQGTWATGNAHSSSGKRCQNPSPTQIVRRSEDIEKRRFVNLGGSTATGKRSRRQDPPK